MAISSASGATPFRSSDCGRCGSQVDREVYYVPPLQSRSERSPFRSTQMGKGSPSLLVVRNGAIGERGDQGRARR